MAKPVTTTAPKNVLTGNALRDSLILSASNRTAMKKKFGIIPMSVLRLSRGALSKQMFIYQREMPDRHTTNYKKTGEKLERLKQIGYTKSQTASQRGMSANGLAATIMPAELVEFFIKYYAKQNDTYLDPFMGQGVQMQVAATMGLNYVGFDVSEEFFAYVLAVKDKISIRTNVQVYLADSRYPDLHVQDSVGDFCFTSPPYWDTEYYGPEDAQLGNAKTYEQFLDDMYVIAKAWLPKFKPNAWVAINVNDFRKNGAFYPYHADTIKLFQKAGYVLYDTWIVDQLLGQLPKAFAVDFNLKHIAPKVHEYVLIFKAVARV